MAPVSESSLKPYVLRTGGAAGLPQALPAPRSLPSASESDFLPAPATTPTVAQRPAVGVLPAVSQRVAEVMAQLAPNAIHYDGHPIDLSQKYGRFDSLADAPLVAWTRKDEGALAAWDDPRMGPALQLSVTHNTSPGGDYFGRALSQNMDSSLWYQALRMKQVIPELPRAWRQAIEAATLMLDIGSDGYGRTGFVRVLAEQQAFPPDVWLKVAFLVGASGRNGLFCEKLFGSDAPAAEFLKKLLNEGLEVGADDFDHQKLTEVEAEAALEGLVTLEQNTGFLQGEDNRELAAASLLIVKLADRSRGSAYTQVAKAEGADVLTSHRLYEAAVTPYLEARAAARA